MEICLDLKYCKWLCFKNVNTFIKVLIELPNLGKSLKPESNAVLLYFLLTQLNSLIFSTYSKLSNSAQISFKQSLTKYAMSMCKSGAFANIVSRTIHLQTATRSREVDTYTDVSYLLWLIKFIVANFVTKRLESQSPTPPRSRLSSKSSRADASNTPNEQRTIEDTDKKFEKTFLNDTNSPAAVATKRTLLSFDLLAFLTFCMLNNFEKLLFNSNAQNMAMLLRMQKRHVVTPPASQTAVAPCRKLVNTRSLKLFYLSVSCVYEIIECINLHLEYLNSSQYRKVWN